MTMCLSLKIIKLYGSDYAICVSVFYTLYKHFSIIRYSSKDWDRGMEKIKPWLSLSYIYYVFVLENAIQGHKHNFIFDGIGLHGGTLVAVVQQ